MQARRVTRCPPTTTQLAAMRAAQRHVAQVLAHGVTPEQVEQARAQIEASRARRQLTLPFFAKPSRP